MNTDFRFDEQRAKQVEAMYKTPDIVAQCREVLRALELRPGERILDVGSGPGLRSLGAEGLYFFSLNRYLFLAVKPGPPTADQ